MVERLLTPGSISKTGISSLRPREIFRLEAISLPVVPFFTYKRLEARIQQGCFGLVWVDRRNVLDS